MNKITCDTCLDLIPLVKDKVASEDSKKLLEDHVKECQTCKEIYESFDRQEVVMDEKHILDKIKRQLMLLSMLAIVGASILGLALSETIGMFYNIIIMPSIGIVAYFALGKKSYYVPFALFLFSYIWLFIKYIAEGMLGEGIIFGVFTIPIYWSAIYTGLCGLGLIIGFLLKYAFGREKNYENK